MIRCDSQSGATRTIESDFFSSGWEGKFFSEEAMEGGGGRGGGGFVFLVRRKGEKEK